jgi:hypothetical protein
MYQKTDEISKQLLSLEKGESVEFPIVETCRIRNIASRTGLKYGREFLTRTNRERGRLIVRRTI